jgi:lipoprotein-releasing system permease protein
MFDLHEKLIAFRYLKSPRKDGFVSVIAGFSFLGITLGVATLIIVMSVMNGFRFELLNKLIGARGHIVVYGLNQPIDENNEIINKIKNIDKVEALYPMVEKQAVITYNNQSRGVGIHGIKLDDLKSRTISTKNLISGSIDSFDEKDYVMVGSRLAESLYLKVGDKISLMIPNGNQTAFGFMPKQRSFYVGAVFELGMHDFDKNFIFMSLKNAQDFFNFQNKLTHLEIFASSLDDAKGCLELIEKQLPNNFQALDWQHSDSSIFQAVEIEKNVMFVILTLIILIATFNVISSLIMLVKDKTKDIAILRTFGASKESILKIFFLAGSSIGIFGTVFGVISGLAFALNIEKIRKFLESLTGVELFSAEIYFLSKLPCKVDWLEVLMVVIMTLLLSFIATLYPAWQASKLDPVEALRS